MFSYLKKIYGTSLLRMINLQGCKNITSSFFMTLYEQNILKNLELLNVEDTSVCKNFIEILTREEDQNDEEEEDEDDQDKDIDQHQVDQKDLALQSQIQSSDQSNILKNLKKDNKELAQQIVIVRKKFEYLNVPYYYKLFNGFYGEVFDFKVLQGNSKMFKKGIKELFQMLKKQYKRIKQKIIKSKESIKLEKKVKKNKAQKNVNQKQKEKITPLTNIQYLNISKCKLIDGADIINFIMKAQCKEKLRTLNMASVNLFNIISKKEEYTEFNRLLNKIIRNFTNLEKLDISDNILPQQCYSPCKDDYTLGKLIKLKASSTNFDLEFFMNSLGSLHELQLANCKQIQREQLDKFLIQIGEYGSEVFNIFKFLSYFKNIINDDVIFLLVNKYKHLNNIHYWNLQRFNLVELNYDEKDMPIFLSRISDNSKVENIDLSSTRVCNNFVYSFLQSRSRSKEQFNQLTLNDCPMVDGSLFDPYNKKTSQITNTKPLSILNFVKTKIKDENTKFFILLYIKQNRKTSYSILDLEQNQFLSEKGLLNILRSSLMGVLTQINLSYTHVNDEVLKVFMTTNKKDKDIKKYSNLKQLKIKGCKDITKEGLQIICESTHFNNGFNLECVFDLPHLLDLDLIKIISNSIYFRNVVYLDLSKYPYQDIDLAVAQLCLKGRDTALSLKILNLNNTWISDHGLQSISVSVNLNKLERIYLQNCPNIQDKGISYLFESKNLKSLDIQYMLLQTGSKCQLRVFDTINQDEKFRKISEIVIYENTLKCQDVQRILEKLRTLSSLVSIKIFSLTKLSQKKAFELFIYIVTSLPHIKYVVFPDEVNKYFQKKEIMISYFK